MASGNSLQVEGIIEQLHVKVKGNLLKFLAYMLAIAGVEIILGAFWLATQGLHIVVYSALLLQFNYNNNFITLDGEQNLPTQIASIHQLRCLLLFQGY